jgi:uncharacterized protein
VNRRPTRLRGWLFLGLALVCGAVAASESRFVFDPAPSADEAMVAKAIAALSESVLSAHAAGHVQVAGTGLAQLRIAAGRDQAAFDAVRAVMDDYALQGDRERSRRWVPYLLHTQARADRNHAFAQSYATAFERYFSDVDDIEAKRAQFWFGGDLTRAQSDLRDTASRLGDSATITLDEALGLARRQSFVDVLASSSLAVALIASDEDARYVVDEDVLIRTPEGVTLSAVVARSRKAASPLPAAMQFTIYAAPLANRETALQAAARGYAGVVVDARGKRLSTDAVRPYETEVDDASAAVEWIARQSWSDGRVAMYGGSYSGFAAWAATKRMPPALKTIVPYVAAIPGFGLPMENNVFLSANYAWPFYVAGNSLLDDAVYFDRERWQRLPEAWYASGRPYREIDRVDGTPNPWLRRWLSHPAYDAYWQAMVPYGDDFARIDIPVLTITGYYDDGQISALQYFKEHLRHRPDAAHYLLIGPYDHFGAQAPFKPRNVGGYDIDPVAQFDTQDITFQWLDHVLHDGPRPALLRDRVNYQLMGADAWHHAPSLESAAEATTFHLSGEACGLYHCLAPSALTTAPLVQTVDFADRTTEGHAYYPNPVVRDGIAVESGFAFVSAPFERPTSVVGTFAGKLKVRIDKRDFDFSVSLYELMPDGKVMQLSYYVGRASHAHDPAHRELLTPGEWTTVPFERTRMTGRRMEADSRLLVVVDVLKDARHQVNMGTGRDVSEESVADAEKPLKIEWHPESAVQVPLREG